MTGQRLASRFVLISTALVGIVAFAYPFVVPSAASSTEGIAHTQDASVITLLLTLLSVLLLLVTFSGGPMTARTIAILGVLTAVNALLRIVPGPAGFSTVFFLLALCGYVYGGSFGFLLGVLSILVSAIIGGGVGPWLPYQMFSAGWMGLTSGWLPDLRRYPRAELVMLMAWTGLWGFIFGAIMNLWFWPYIAPAQSIPGQNWEFGIGFWQALQRYAVFYVATSLWWDAWRAAGNAALIMFLGPALLKVLRRFERILTFVMDPQGP
jgi:energy-coupling factor transport system substrate-specific component